jgi:hypothetical protein
MRLIITILTIAAITMANIGCSAFRPPKEVLTITANPKDAIVFVNGIKYHPPIQVPVKRDQAVFVQCEYAGLDPQTRIIESHLNGTAFLDAVGFILFLVPGFGLLTPGSHSLDYTTVNMDLYHPYVPPAPVKPIARK